MNEKKILEHLSNSIEQAPIQLLETIKATPRVKQLDHDDITRQKKAIPSMRLMTAVASFFFLVALLNFQIQYRTVDSRVYLDVNPSILIETNRHDKVIDMISLNPEGDIFIEDYLYKGKTLNQVTVELVDKLVMSNYITKDNNLMLVSVYNGKNEKANQQKTKIKDAILQHLASNDIHPVILTQAIDQSNTLKDMAKQNKISEGKMTLIRNLMHLSPKLKVEPLAKLSLEQLIGLAKYMALDLSQVVEKQELDQIELPDTNDEFYDAIIEEDANDNADDDDVDDDADDSDDDPTGTTNEDVTSETTETSTASNTESTSETAESPTAAAPEENTRMSAENARQAVLGKFGGIIEKIEYAYDDNDPHYKGEAIKEGSRVVFELNARTELFTKWDIANDTSWDSFAGALPNLITMNQAANLVVKKSDQANTFVQKIDFKWDDSEPFYQGEAFNKGVKYTFEIDANSGDFRKWDIISDDETWAENFFNVR